MRRGGNSGPALTSGKSKESLLVARITERDEHQRMPPESEGQRLTAEQIARIRAWIDQGAIGPADEKPEPDPREHWAFRPVVRPAQPRDVHPVWVRNPIDAFIGDEHGRRGLRPQPPANRGTLLRRVYIDLVGLPPTREELAAFQADESPQAYERIVERLLASPQYGERWGRHFMDIWRYSDWWGLGAEVRNSQKHIWHWRDWLVESLNADLGYDEMLRQMLAADELYPTDLAKLRASGYLARQYFKFNRTTWLDETIEHTSKAFLGLTVNCSKCHDHKYDPISQEDYYRLRAFFEPYQVRMEQVSGELDYEKGGIPRVFDCNLEAPTYLFTRGDEKRPQMDKQLTPGLPAIFTPLWGEVKIEPISLPPEAHQPGLRPHVLANHLAAADRQIAATRSALEQAKSLSADSETPESRARLELARRALAAAEMQPTVVRARAAADRARYEQSPAANAAELARAAARAEREAAVAKASEDVARAELELLKAEGAKKPDMEKKLAAAKAALDAAQEALDSPSESYTSLAGALKTLESNLETEASRKKPFPTRSTGRRSALARWITDRRNPLTPRVLVNHLWSRHFGQPLAPTVFDFGRKGAPPTHPPLIDWLAAELMDRGWSMKHIHRLIVTSNTYRLSSSSAGAAATNLMYDPDNKFLWRMNPVRLEAQVVRDALLHLSGEMELTLGGPPVEVGQEQSRRRSMYFFHSHNEHHRFLSMFDDASVLECYRRAESIVPQQALALSNSREARSAAEKIASRLNAEPQLASDDAFIRAAFHLVLCDTPTPAEHAACVRALSEFGQAQPAGPGSRQRGRTNLIHALLNHNDFVTRR
jgi:hypothetical protein